MAAYGENRIRRWKKGVMTVEASVIVPCIVLVTAALMILTFFVHNRNWYRSAALESAMLANSRFTEFSNVNTVSPDAAVKAAEERARQRAEEQTMPGTKPTFSVTGSRSGTTVSFSGQEYAMYGKIFDHHPLEETVDRVWPVEGIRTARNLRAAVSGLTDGQMAGKTEDSAGD